MPKYIFQCSMFLKSKMCWGVDCVEALSVGLGRCSLEITKGDISIFGKCKGGPSLHYCEGLETSPLLIPHLCLDIMKTGPRPLGHTAFVCVCANESYVIYLSCYHFNKQAPVCM